MRDAVYYEHCSNHTNKWQYVAFFYNKNGRLCHLFHVMDNPTVISTPLETPDIHARTYGWKSKITKCRYNRARREAGKEPV